ncbi:MAG: Gfo/Idh/MocA family oxidoreductase [SAR202 cluster bacterium]|nr:Gfo/Idh/MocA family oxidoreductase [SAR202 cluster bacterium]|tara:strand:+ start:11611 stop:12765 length:1155 start_codon:yes stop_codon:yes gene_type:complete
MKKYKTAIVGCGGIGHAHMEGYEKIDEIDVIACCDTVPSAVEYYKKEFNIPNGYTDIEEMLEKSQPEIVSVCVWHLLHDEITIKLSESPHVKGIICEKPMAIGIDKANSMVEACKKNDTKLVVSHQRRFTPGWIKAKEIVENGEIGIPTRAELRVKDGLLNWGTHSIDGARFILGDPKAKWVVGSVERYTNKYERDTPIEDSCTGLIHFENDLQFFIQSDLMDNDCDAGKFEIYGTEGFLKITETEVKIFNKSSNGWKDVEIPLRDGDVAIGGNTNAEQTLELIDWIEGGEKHRGAGDVAAETVEIMMGIYESARINRVVKFPLEVKGYPLEKMIEEGLLELESNERYDIRGFLKRENIDEDLYARLRDDGLSHHEAMRAINES